MQLRKLSGIRTSPTGCFRLSKRSALAFLALLLWSCCGGGPSTALAQTAGSASAAYFSLNTDPGWTRQGAWAYGAPTGHGGQSYGHPDPTAGPTGPNVFGVNLNGNYSTAIGGPYYLITSAINLSNFTGTQLQFQRWLNSDYPPFVYATVDVSNDGVNWTNVFTNSGEEDSAWTLVQYDISAVADGQSTVYLRWGYSVSYLGAYPMSGWNIDDIQILGNPENALALSLSSYTATEAGAPITATLSISPTPTAATVVTLSTSDPNSLSVPPNVTIPAGQSSVTFSVTPLDDGLLDGSRNIALTALANGYFEAAATVLVNDHETATLGITAPSPVGETAGPVTASVTVSAAPAVAVTVAVSSSDPTVLQVPPTVTIPAGQTSASFQVTITNSDRIDSAQAATITAHVTNWTDGTASVTVTDPQNTSFGLALPASVSTGFTGTATISIGGVLSSPLIISLASSNPSLLGAPASVTIPAGQTAVAFALTAPPNTIAAGTVTVTLTASASGFTTTSATTTVVPHQDYFTEQFFYGSNNSDIANQSFLFTPNSSSSGYSVVRSTASSFPTSPTGGTQLVMYDDNYQPVQLTNASVTLYGLSYSTFYVGSNGYLTFDYGESTYYETLADHFFQPRISGWFHDLNPGVAGSVSWVQLADRVAVTYQNVPDYGSSDSNSFQIEMFFNGQIRLTYLAMDSLSGIIGLSQGEGLPSNFVASNFATYPTSALHLSIPSVATKGQGVLAGQGSVSLTTAQANAISISLSSSNTSKVTLPATIVIPAGQTSATFNLTIIDNGILDGSQVATVTAAATGFGADSQSITVQDNEIATLTVSAPAQVAEGVGIVYGNLSVSPAPAAAVTVALSSNDTITGLQVPPTVVIPLGQTSVTFPITVVNSDLLELSHSVTLTAHVANWNDGEAAVYVLTDDNTNLTLWLPTTVPVGGTATGTVWVSGILATPLTVSLASNNGNLLTVPATVAIPAGAASVNFTVTAPAGTLISGSAPVTVTASATGFTSAALSTSVAVTKDYFTEQFIAGSRTPDVSYQSFLFVPNGSANFYSVLRSSVAAFPTNPIGGAILPMYDDNAVQVTPSGGAAVSLYGVSYPSFYVSSNGFLTFDSGAFEYDESLSIHFSRPQISGWFHDLNPGVGGSVSWLQLSDRVAVTYQNVPDYAAYDSNSFQIEMFFDGRIRMTYLGIAAPSGIIGLSQGLGLPFDYLPSDFDEYPTEALQLAIPSAATKGVGVLAGQGSVTLPSAPASAVTVALISSNTSEVTVPATVTIPAGQLSATFNLTIIDNGLLDGSQNAIILASAAGFASALQSITVQDNHVATLSVSAPASVSEGGGVVQGVLTISAAPAVAVAVSVSSSNVSALQVPATVTIPAGQTTINFPVTIINHNQINGVQTATITAHEANWIDGSASVTVNDFQNTNLTLALPVSISSGVAGTGTISIGGTLPAPLALALSSGNSLLLSAPSSVTIPAGATSVSFTLTVPAGASIVTATPISITASASGFTTASATTTVFPPPIASFPLNVDPGWSRQGEWAFGPPTGQGGGLYGHPDPTGGPTSVNVFGINLNGNYNTLPGGYAFLTTSPINLSSYTGTQLRFNRWLNCDISPYVDATVDVSNDATHWTNVFANSTVFPVTDSAWTTVQYDISSVADGHSAVYIRWGHRVASSGAFAFSGWNIDGIEILGTFSAPLTVSLAANTVTKGAAPITGTVSIPTAVATDTVVTLSSSISAAAAPPATVTIPAGQTSATFTVTIENDTLLTGTRNVTLTASAVGYFNGATVLAVNDSNTATLSLVTPTSVFENAETFHATLLVSAPPAVAVNVSLSSNDTTALQVPAIITIPAGLNYVGFNVTVINNPNLTGTRPATITAQVTNWTSAVNSVNVLDTQNTDLTLSLPATILKGGSGVGTVSTSANVIAPHTITLSSGSSSQLSVPASVTIPAGASSVTFTLSAPQDQLTDGTIPVTITASSTGFINGTAVTSVLDDNVQHFAFSVVPSAQSFGIPFGVTINAVDVHGAPIPGYTGSPTLSASGTGGTDVVSPTTTGSFTAGVWTGTVTVSTLDTNIILTVSDGAGHTGSSNAFTVTSNPIVEPRIPVSTVAGGSPHGGFVVGSDGNLYGTTLSGGSSNEGTVYKMSTSGALTALVDFYGANGIQPYGGLVQGSDGNFYGTTSGGGVNNLGTVFKVTPSGALTTLAQFSVSTGGSPKAGLLLASDGNFYGTTSIDGIGYGTIFKMTPAGVVTTLVSFTGTSGSYPGAGPQAALIQAADGYLYGVTSGTGSTGSGTVFKVSTTGAFTNLVTFSGSSGSYLGSLPQAALVQGSDLSLYGVTSTGGSSNLGTVFKVTTGGSFTNLFSFTGATGAHLGSSPQGTLVQWTDGNFYGTTSSGGTGTGTVYKVSSTGTQTVLRNLTNSASDTQSPYGALALASNGSFYGTGSTGALNGRGGAFQLNPSTSVFTDIMSFPVTPASYRFLLSGSDGNIYGCTEQGGTSSDGSVVQITPAGVTTTLANFTYSTGESPSSLIQGSDGNLYGTLQYGGTVGYGVVFKLTTGGVLTSLANFSGSSGAAIGQQPVGGLTQGADGYLYGVTYTGGSGYGTIFKVSTSGAFTSLVSFTGTSGANPGSNPQTRLAQGSDGTLYGTTTTGGASGDGTVYKVTPAGVFTSLVSFTNTSGSYPGYEPESDLLLASDGNLYGTTVLGGSSSSGTVYRVTTSGVFTSLASLTGSSGAAPGSQPYANLIQGSDGNIYGTTDLGGSSGTGTLFRLSLAGQYTSLVSFTGNSGAAPGIIPASMLTQSPDGCLYGVNYSGGTYGLGTIFRFLPNGSLQTLYSFGGANDGGSPNPSGAYNYSDSYRLVVGGDGYLYGCNGSTVFRVHQQPALQSFAAGTVSPTSATLSGVIVPNEDPATVFIQYGLNASYGSVTSLASLTPGTSATPFSFTLTGLAPGAVYHYRIVTETAEGVYYTADQTFATPNMPIVITGSFIGAGQTGVCLDGVVNPLGVSTNYYFQYGLDTTYGQLTPQLSAGNGVANVSVSATVKSLQAATTYHFRLAAVNAYGTSYGDDQVIATLPVATGVVQPMFQYLNSGVNPESGLMKGSDGNYYGALSSGGSAGVGSIYRLTHGGSLTTLANLSVSGNGAASTGSLPQCVLLQGSDGNFYGTTSASGLYSGGTIFRMTPSGAMSVLVNFTTTGGSAPGSNPFCGLTLGADGNFYGTTQGGGGSGGGTIFQYNPAGQFTSLASFTGASGSVIGSSPRASLTSGSDGNLYGTTATGGAGGNGTIFKISTSGTFTSLLQFTGSTGAYLGATPLGALVQGTDGNFYGTTSSGGTGNDGTVFKMTPAGALTTLVNFTGTTGSYLGASPKGGLVQDSSGLFYGTTQSGGTGGLGTVFSVSSAGAFNSLVSLTGVSGTALGQSPNGDLISDGNGSFFGTTYFGGLYASGSVFKVTNTGIFTTLVNLQGWPTFSRLAQGADGNLYGATVGGAGSANLNGSLFVAGIGEAPSVLDPLPAISGNGVFARGGVTLGPDLNFYGATQGGGNSSLGSVYQLTPAGVYTTLLSFTGNIGTAPGLAPSSPLTLGSDGNFYGATSSGGSGGIGEIYGVSLSGAQTSVLSFTGTTGAYLGSYPQGPLLLASDSNYYGTTSMGGVNGGYGTVFQRTPSGTFTSLASFSNTSAPNLGNSPTGALAQGSDGNIYGVTASGGLSTYGTVFKVTPAGVLTSLASFTGATGSLPGQSPTGLYAGPDSCLYGVCSAGGAYGLGSLFRVTPDGTVLTLYSFSGQNDGMDPNYGLCLASDGYFYGGDYTAMYRVSPPPAPVTSLATDVLPNSATLNGSIAGETYSGTIYFQYGPTTSYGFSTHPESFAPGTSAASVSVPVVGLQPFVTYHYQLVSVSSIGVFAGADLTFSTPSAAIFNSASDVPVTAAGFNASGEILSLQLGFAPSAGTVLTLIDNTSFSPVTGIFNGLPNGSVVSAVYGNQTYYFIINYAGGDGNDVTLTAVSQGITFPAIPGQLTTSPPFSLSASATSGLPVSYSVVSGGASASVSGSQVTLTGVPGVVTIQASQAGNGSIGSAPPVEQTFNVGAVTPSFVQISGSKSTDAILAIRSDGTLWAWGANSSSQLGDGSSTTRHLPVQIGTATNWKSVSAGGQHTVAVRTDGTLWAWGANSYGQVGDGTTILRSAPTQIGVGSSWNAVVAGYSHSVAVRADGTLWAWGYNFDGELGQGSTDSSAHSTPVQVGSVSNWVNLAAGAYHTIASRTDGSLWAWGYNYYGQIGDGSTTTRTSPVQTGVSTAWTSLSAGYYSSYGLHSDGTLWSWGQNTSGQLGDGTVASRTSPAQVGSATNWLSIQGGSNFAVGIQSNGSYWSWGQNYYGQLGQGFADPTLHPSTPSQVGTAASWSVAGASNSTAFGVQSDGTLWSWGLNLSGQLGYEARLPLPTFAASAPVSSAASGPNHSLIIMPDGSLRAFGGNAYGELGQGSTDSASHLDAASILPGTTWSTVSAGRLHSAAIRSDGTLWVWGYNAYGQLGDGTTTTASAPEQIGTSQWIAVSAASYHTLAVRNDGTLWAWGYNASSQLGDGTTIERNAPVQIGSATNWLSVYAADGDFSLGLHSDGTLWAWGNNASGQIGNGTLTTQSTPFQVGTATIWSSVAAGTNHVLATRTDGTLWAWGGDLYSQLGDGGTTARTAPGQVGTDTHWATASAALYSSFGIKTNGSLWVWGSNAFGQLGDGTFASHPTPAMISSSTSWAALPPISGAAHALLVTTDGTLWGSGDAGMGQVGYACRNPFVPDLVLPALSPAQTIAFPAIGSVQVGGSVALAAAASSGLPVSYVVTGPAIVANGSLFVNGPGTVNVAAYQPGDHHWQSSDLAIQSLTPMPSSDATLSSLALTGTALSTVQGQQSAPQQSPAPSGMQIVHLSAPAESETPSYTATVANPITSVVILPTSSSPYASIQVNVNGGAFSLVPTGNVSAPLALSTGLNLIDVVVSAQDGVTTNSYQIAVTRHTAFQDWAGGIGLTGTGSGPLDQPAGDGISNLIKYAFNMNPFQSGTLPSQTSLQVNPDDGRQYLTVSYPRLIGATGITYTVEASSDLSTWSSSPSNITQLSATANSDGVTETVTVRVSPPISSGNPTTFARVTISSP